MPSKTMHIHSLIHYTDIVLYLIILYLELQNVILLKHIILL